MFDTLKLRPLQHDFCQNGTLILQHNTDLLFLFVLSVVVSPFYPSERIKGWGRKKKGSLERPV